METSEQIKQIKRSFRLYMNGVVSSSMRQKGLEYRVNWGISQVQLRAMAVQYGKDKALSNALWHDNVRECKILATLIMPASEFTLGEAVEWTDTLLSTELAETVALNLFQHMPSAESMLPMLLNSSDVLKRICAYSLACRLARRGLILPGQIADKLLDRSATDIKSPDRQVLHALVNCLDCISQQHSALAPRAGKLLNDAGFGAF